MKIPLARWTHRATTVGVALLVVVAVAACQPTAPLAATVNGHVISEGTLDHELHAIQANPDYLSLLQQNEAVQGQGQGTFALAFTDQVLTRQILLELIHEEVLRRHLLITTADLDRATHEQQAQIDQGQPSVWEHFAPSYQGLLIRRTAEIDALTAAIGATHVDEAAIEKYYNDNLQTRFVQNCVSHILVNSQAEAEQLRAQLVGGADFATLARRFSQDPGSAPKGGDLGCAPPGTYVPEFEQVADTLAVGQLSPVVKTQFGYHIIEVTARKTEPLSAVRDQVIQALQQQNQSAVTNFIEQALASAKIVVNPRYGSFSRSGTQLGVVPPNTPTAAQGGLTPTTLPLTTGP